MNPENGATIRKSYFYIDRFTATHDFYRCPALWSPRTQEPGGLGVQLNPNFFEGGHCAPNLNMVNKLFPNFILLLIYLLFLLFSQVSEMKWPKSKEKNGDRWFLALASSKGLRPWWCLLFSCYLKQKKFTKNILSFKIWWWGVWSEGCLTLLTLHGK